MPISPPRVTAAILNNLTAVSFVGVGVPKLAQALGIGVTTWTAKITVQTTDSGTAGAGKGIPIPIIVAPPILSTNLTSGFASQEILGLASPALIQGLTKGLVQAYSTALTNTAHAGVGLGTGLAIFQAPPAFKDLKLAFDGAGVTGTGSTQICKAIAQGLESTFNQLKLPQPITGPPSIAPGVGKGMGNIV